MEAYLKDSRTRWMDLGALKLEEKGQKAFPLAPKKTQGREERWRKIKTKERGKRGQQKEGQNNLKKKALLGAPHGA